MKLTIKITIFLLLPYICFPQNTNFKDYYKHCNQAELKIIDSSFAEALAIYQSSFKQFENNYGQDIHNACLCAILSKQNDIAEELLEKMVFKGYTIDYFKSNTYERFKKTKEWKSFKKNYPKLREEFMKSFNYDLKTEIEKMYEAEKTPLLSERALDSIVYENTKGLYEIFTTKGFPKINMFDLRMPVPIPLVVHCFGLYNKIKNSPAVYNDPMYLKMDFQKYNLIDIYLKAVKEGLFHPNDYISCHDYREKNIFGCKIIFKIDFKTKICKAEMPDSSVIIESNAKRDEIGLPLVEDTYKKIIKSDFIYMNYPFYKYENLIFRLENDLKYKALKTLDERSYYYSGEIMNLENEYNKKHENKSLLSEFILSGMGFQYSADFLNMAPLKRRINLIED